VDVSPDSYLPAGIDDQPLSLPWRLGWLACGLGLLGLYVAGGFTIYLGLQTPGRTWAMPFWLLTFLRASTLAMVGGVALFTLTGVLAFFTNTDLPTPAFLRYLHRHLDD
jgi:hypothetical protein